MEIPDDICKYALGLYGPRSVVNYTASPWSAGSLAQLPDNQIISYHYDSYGFRKAEGVIGKRVAFGCSHTFGYEVAVENSYPFLLNATNFGVTAASPQTVARLVQNWIPNSEVEEVIILMPEKSRREIWNPNTATYTMMLPWNLDQYSRTVYDKHGEWVKLRQTGNDTEDPKRVMKFLEEHPHLDVLDDKKNSEILDECIESVKRNVGERKLILKTMDDVPPPDFKARDRTHNGDAWQRKVAQLFQREL